MKLDILAIGAHPDDVELSCSGTLMLHKLRGKLTGILDLTEGELGSRGSVAIRQKESAQASAILQLDLRENLGFRDGFFSNDEWHQLRVIEVLRKYRPNMVLANAPKDRHPDHSRAAKLVEDACYLSGLVKIETTADGVRQEAWRPKRIFHYIQDQHLEPSFVIDISNVFEYKIKSIEAYASQFDSTQGDGPITYISENDYLNKVRYRSIMMGKKIGTKYGEGFICLSNTLGLKSFDEVVLPDLV